MEICTRCIEQAHVLVGNSRSERAVEPEVNYSSDQADYRRSSVMRLYIPRSTPHTGATSLDRPAQLKQQSTDPTSTRSKLHQYDLSPQPRSRSPHRLDSESCNTVRSPTRTPQPGTISIHPTLNSFLAMYDCWFCLSDLKSTCCPRKAWGDPCSQEGFSKHIQNRFISKTNDILEIQVYTHKMPNFLSSAQIHTRYGEFQQTQLKTFILPPN